MKNYKYLIMALLLIVNLSVQAATVELTTGKNSQTVDGQVFSFDFANTPISDGVDGELFFTARGDYSLGFTNENITITLDSISLGSYSFNNSSLITFYNQEDNEWGMSMAVPGGFLQPLTEDGNLNMIVTLSSDVNLGLSEQQGYLFDPYIDVTLRYTTAAPIPVPLSIWLLASGLLSLIGVRRMNLKKHNI